MTIIESPPQVDLVQRATDLIPLIRKHADWQEQNRVLHDEVIAAMQEAGLLKMRVPTRYGGSVPDVRTVVDVIAELGRGDGSVGWSVSTMTIGAWLAGLLPDEAQDEIFADPDVRFCGSVGPNGVAVPTEGGYILNGRWHFNTAAQQADWDTHSIMIDDGEGNLVPGLAVVPMSDLTVIDDWHTVGLRATGSVTTIAQDLFVPAARVLPMLPVLMFGQHASKENAASDAWKVPFLQFAVAAAAAPALGMARAAWESFMERLPSRQITYTNYERQIDAPLTHLQVAEARVKIDEAEWHLHRAADRLQSKAISGEPWTLEDRTAARMDAAVVCERAKEAVDILNTASGGSSVYSHVPMQRIERDVQTINLHGVMHPNTNAETYGRVLCGLEPNTLFL
ncbi:acyl-CoA dehydrogenase family protein [Jatrophihabitans sp.]|jgi:alkylation response protein AidB-like acyl-CoA dehydrogenase|uniref:acyl-CoA dehydrogenase family protein n=1 Tax=Jatrophihabitans sp. TaxID=1932789 RepID=UPI002EDDFA36